MRHCDAMRIKMDMWFIPYKKGVYFVGTYNKSAFNLFFVPSWVWSCFCLNREKISFSRADFLDSTIVIWGMTILTGFYKWVHILFKKQHVSDCQKKYFVREFQIFNSWRDQKLLLVANQLQDGTLLFEINSEDIGISLWKFQYFWWPIYNPVEHL